MSAHKLGPARNAAVNEVRVGSDGLNYIARPYGDNDKRWYKLTPRKIDALRKQNVIVGQPREQYIPQQQAPQQMCPNPNININLGTAPTTPTAPKKTPQIKGGKYTRDTIPSSWFQVYDVVYRNGKEYYVQPIKSKSGKRWWELSKHLTRLQENGAPLNYLSEAAVNAIINAANAGSAPPAPSGAPQKRVSSGKSSRTYTLANIPAKFFQAYDIVNKPDGLRVANPTKSGLRFAKLTPNMEQKVINSGHTLQPLSFNQVNAIIASANSGIAQETGTPQQPRVPLQQQQQQPQPYIKQEPLQYGDDSILYQKFQNYLLQQLAQAQQPQGQCPGVNLNVNDQRFL